MTKQYSIPGFTEFNLEEHTDIWMNGILIFYGYQTPKDTQDCRLWGQTVPFSAEITPEGFPIKDPPLKTWVSTEKYKLKPDRDALIKECHKVAQEIKKFVLPPPTPELEQEYQKHYDAEAFLIHLTKAMTIWKDTRQIAEKIREILPLLAAMDALIRDIQLPQKLMRDDTGFAMMLAKFLVLIDSVREHAKQAGVELPSDINGLRNFLDSFLDQLIAAGNHLQGIERPMTPEEDEEDSDLLIAATYDCTLSVDDKLQLFRKLWENPLRYPEDRLLCIDRAVALVNEEEEADHIPDLTRHVAAIGAQLGKLEAEGAELWQQRVAEQFLESANIWREGQEDLPQLTEESFAARIRLDSVHTAATEENNVISCTLDLYFTDEDDSLAGHWMFVHITDGKVTEYNIMG